MVLVGISYSGHGMITRSQRNMSTINEVHALLLEVQKEQKESNSKIDQLLADLKAKDERILALEKRVEELTSFQSVSKNTIKKLEVKCDDNEQYSRRPSLRISNIPSAGYGENATKCVELVIDALKVIPGVDLSKEDIVRAHRVGRVTGTDNTRPRQMIVRFKSWDIRTKLYKGRKSLANNQKISLDLTKRRFALKMLAIEKAKGNDKIDYVFSDINCSLCVKLSSGEYVYFNTEEELVSILS